MTDQQGYTQGVGLSYEVDFNTFQELLRKLFQKKQGDSSGTGTETIQAPPPATMGPDSLIQFYSKNKKPF